MNCRKLIFKIAILFAMVMVISINYKYKVLILPVQNLVDYQFNLFTVASSLAGFTFTTLGILLGMGSETFMNQIKDTNIVTERCEKITISFVFFCVSCIISLYFIVGGNNVVDRILFKIFKCDCNIINQSIYLIEVLCLLAGLVFFIISVYSVYDLIKRIYGYKTKNYGEERKKFIENLNAAKQRQNFAENKTEKADDFLEK